MPCDTNLSKGPAREVKKGDSDEKYANMELPWDRTYQGHSINAGINPVLYFRIQHAHKSQGSANMASSLQEMYVWFRFSPKEDKKAVIEQDLKSFKRLQVITDKNVEDCKNHEKTRWQECWWHCWQRATGVSHGTKGTKVSCLLVSS